MLLKKWQNLFSKDKLSNPKEKFFVLKCFLILEKIHMGHVRNYTIGDVIADLNL